ncbi:MAG: hypothetical protein K6B74_02580 [Ruminococcus sp.]|nr:hypothetical protein [Ruminococcus sp.]
MPTKAMNIFFIIAILLYAVVLIWSIVHSFRTKARLRRETNAVKVLRSMKYVKTALICAAFSAALSAVIIYFDCDEIREIKSGLKDSGHVSYSKTETTEEYRERLLGKSTAHCKIWALLCFGWTLTAVLRANELKNHRHAIITENGVYLSDSFSPCEKVRYYIKDDRLLMYFGKRNTPAEYGIFENRELLLSTLSANYKLYSENYEGKES